MSMSVWQCIWWNIYHISGIFTQLLSMHISLGEEEYQYRKSSNIDVFDAFDFMCPVKCGVKLLTHSQTSTVEVREWISNFIPQFIICDCFSMLGFTLIYVRKRGSGSNDSKLWRYFRLFWHAIMHVCAGNLINLIKWTAFGIAIILMETRNIL